MNERRTDDSTHWCSDFDGNEKLDTEVNNVGDMGVVHTLVADEGVVCIDQVEARELMLEVIHEEVGENNHLRQQCKKLLLGLEIFNDKVYNNFFLPEALFIDLQIFQNSWVWDYHLGVHLLWAIILAWGAPPNQQQWGTPPNAQQWDTPPNPQQWSVQPSFQQWEKLPNA
ncbi:unnamed protein product [Brassica rapa subsp. trilocularis]